MDTYDFLELLFGLFFNASWFYVAWLMITSFADGDENSEALTKPIKTTTNEKENL
jgi:hypothetical protein